MSGVKGKVTDYNTGNAISGATVTIIEDGAYAITQPDGSYLITHGPGNFTLRADAAGYTSQQKPVTIPATSYATVNFRLKI